MSVPSSQTPSPPALELSGLQLNSLPSSCFSTGQSSFSAFNGYGVRNSDCLKKLTLQSAKQTIDNLNEDLLNAEMSNIEWKILSDYCVRSLSQIAGCELSDAPQQQKNEEWHQELQSIRQELLSIEGKGGREKRVKDALKKCWARLRKQSMMNLQLNIKNNLALKLND